jgi:hypothetical protein
MDKYKTAYKRLQIVFWVYVVCLIIPFFGFDLSGGIAALWLGIHIVSSLAYIYFLGVLINGTDRSFGNWVGGAILFGPFGVIFTFFQLKTIAILRGWD